MQRMQMQTRIYQELKQKSFRRRNMEEKENRLSVQMMREANVEEEQIQTQRYYCQKLELILLNIPFYCTKY